MANKPKLDKSDKKELKQMGAKKFAAQERKEANYAMKQGRGGKRGK